jgi:hypothetical protein
MLDMPEGVRVSGVESDGAEQFFCGGGNSGKLRAVRRPKRDTRSSDAQSPVDATSD